MCFGGGVRLRSCARMLASRAIPFLIILSGWERFKLAKLMIAPFLDQYCFHEFYFPLASLSDKPAVSH